VSALHDDALTLRRQRTLGFVFQFHHLLHAFTALENVTLPALAAEGRVTPQRLAQARELLAAVGLSHAMDKRPLELSGGMQQRASIVRCLSYAPEVILMDEPFGALDAFTRDEMNLLIQRLWMETGKTIIFVTHNVSEAIFLADRVVVLTPRPGRLAHIFPIDLPRPRTIEMTFEPEFIADVIEIKRTIETGVYTPSAAD